MKYAFVLLLAWVHATDCMETESTGRRKNPLQRLRTQQASGNDQSIDMLQMGPGLHTKDGFVTIDFKDDVTQNNSNSVPILDLRKSASDVNTVSVEQWKTKLENAIKHGKSSELITLLSKEGQPATRSTFFTPYTDALTQIKAHKEREERILTNKPFEGSKCCCNGTYIWNRYVAPTAILATQIGIICFSGWGIAKSVTGSFAKNEEANEPKDYVAAAGEAAPSIGSLVFALLTLPFNVTDAYHRHILKRQQSKYEYYTITEHSVKTQENIQQIVEDNNKLLREQNTPLKTELQDQEMLSSSFSGIECDEPN